MAHKIEISQGVCRKGIQIISSASIARFVGYPGAVMSLKAPLGDGTIIKYSGNGQFCDFTDPDLLIAMIFSPNRRIANNIFNGFKSSNRSTPNPLYLLGIQLMQLAYFETLRDYYYYIEVKAIRIIGTLPEE